MAGVADLVVLLTQGKSFYIEMKVKCNCKKDNQKAFQDKAITLGHPYTVCYSFEEFKAAVESVIEKIQ